MKYVWSLYNLVVFIICLPIIMVGILISILVEDIYNFYQKKARKKQKKNKEVAQF
jgi:hypothetical protein